ncbi:tetratricopeptide repeat protein [Streptomyces sp. NPDC050560]|uniref:tetratricopeptide repeat protein n=1 Tax=Streptomyces sp. NPDC050560 TaxID=3365630 RepID=UPI0037981AC7
MGLFGRKRPSSRSAGQGGDAMAVRTFDRAKREFLAGRFEAAAALFREVVALAPDSPNSQYLLGASLFKAGDSGAAAAPLRRSVEMRPEHAEARLVLGMSLGRLGEFAEAEVHMAKAASLGDRQARGLLPGIGIDYCRACGGPAHFRAGDNGDGGDGEGGEGVGGEGGGGPAIIVTDINAGMRCARCHTVRCGPCATGGRLGPMILDCPDCGGPLEVLTR